MTSRNQKCEEWIPLSLFLSAFNHCHSSLRSSQLSSWQFFLPLSPTLRCSYSKVVLNKKSSNIYKYQQKINSLSMFCQPNINFSFHQQKIYFLPIIYQLKVTKSSIQKHSINTLSTQNQLNINPCYTWSYSTLEDQRKINDKSNIRLG